MAKKVVLAFSGGLDTSYCVIYLKEQGYEVHTALVNTGGFDVAELDQVEQQAKSLGAVSHINLEETQPFYEDCLRYLLFGNVLKNNTYPLSVSAERAFQAKAIADYASLIGADAVAHGSTGAGNDQVRFDLAFLTADRHFEIITPIRDQSLSREEEIDYLKAHGVEKDWEKALYSVNKGLWGTSVGGKETLTSDTYLPEDAWPTPFREQEAQSLTLLFEQGEAIGVEGKELDGPIEVIQYLHEVAAPYGIGRDIHVGDTIIGIKGRVGFEAPAPLILIKAHHLLEKHILSKWQLILKEQLAPWYGHLIHEGQWMEPALRDIEAFLLAAQAGIEGKVHVRLEPYRFVLEGIESPADRMRADFGSYGEMNRAWSGEEVKGFTKILSNSSRIQKTISKNKEGRS